MPARFLIAGKSLEACYSLTQQPPTTHTRPAATTAAFPLGPEAGTAVLPRTLQWTGPSLLPAVALCEGGCRHGPC